MHENALTLGSVFGWWCISLTAATLCIACFCRNTEPATSFSHVSANVD